MSRHTRTLSANMITEYYCKKCRESFHEEKLPNINKTHTCGNIARVIEHEADEEER